MKRLMVALAVAGIFASVVPAQEDDSERFDQESTRAAFAYKLNGDNFKLFLNATRTLTGMVNHNPAVKSGFGDFATLVKQHKGKKSLDFWTDALEKSVPAAAAAIRTAGLTPRDYFIELIIIGEAAVDESFHAEKPSPEVSLENAAFVRAHSQEIDQVVGAFSHAMDSQASRETK